MTEKVLKITSASNWKHPEPRVVTLPSGNIAALLPPNTYVLHKEGRIPDSALRMMNDEKDMSLLDKQEAIEWQVSSFFVSPKCVIVDPDIESGEISTSMLTDADKKFIFDLFSEPEEKKEDIKES